LPARLAIVEPGGSSDDADVILVGHTHLPFIGTVEHRTILNPGSVGQPKDRGPDAS
jgi:protein phosphatase